MLIALALHQVLQSDTWLQRRRWVREWSDFVFARVSPAALAILLSLLLPLLLAHWLLTASARWLFGLPELLLMAAMLVWSLGRDDYHTTLEKYEALSGTGDPVAAAQAMDQLWLPDSEPPVEEPSAADRGHDSGHDSVHDSVHDSAHDSAHDRALERLAYSGFSRWFAPLFYFLVIGPLGAVGYRLVKVHAEQGKEARYLVVLQWLDWLPARALGLSFALLGDFLGVIGRPGLRGIANDAPAHQQLRVQASAACGGRCSARELGELLYRCAGLWLVLASLGFIFL
jgi:AmpE protein